MGTYVNPGKSGFVRIRNDVYVDKSGLIEFFNSCIEGYNNMICVSRPRRFGKSFAAKMLCAYYDKSCDAHELFDDLLISKSANYKKYLNKYDILYLDITRFISTTQNIKNVVKEIQAKCIAELNTEFPNCLSENETVLADALSAVTMHTGDKFFVIIDEWDALFREEKSDTSLQKEYVQLLRGLFKGGVATDQSIAGAFMTGILPIKKYGTESALTDFVEYSMVEPFALAQYVGFTEDEVKKLCIQNNIDFDGMNQWYNGYYLDGVGHIYSPNSVMKAVKNRKFANYWTKTEAYESLKNYISINMDGLKDDIIAMLGGQRVRVNTLSFQNDITSFKNKNDVMTLLIHLGYLAYDEASRRVYIPNLEVSESFKIAVEDTDWTEVSKALEASDELLQATIDGDAEAVAYAISAIHESSSSVLRYNDENSLACALTIAYYTAKRDYIIIRELPTGKGFADLAFIPRKASDKPAMIIEWE